MGGVLHKEFFATGFLQVLNIIPVQYLAADILPIAIVSTDRIVGVPQSVVTAEKLTSFHIGGLYPVIAAFRHPFGNVLLLLGRGHLQTLAAPQEGNQAEHTYNMMVPLHPVKCSRG